MTMTRQHFEVIADIIATAENWTDPRDFIANQLAAYFSEINPRFSQMTFLDACKV